MKKIILTLTLYLSAFGLSAQLTIENCQEKARANYPLIRQQRLIEISKEYNLSNAARGYLPQIQLKARASYQSEITSIDLPQIAHTMGIDIPKPPKDQYQAYIEAGQTIWDGGYIHSQRKIAKAGAEAETQRLEVDLYALENRVNQLFFGILALDAQLEQNRLLRDELARNLDAVTSFVKNGIANQADIDAVKAENLNAQQIRVQLESARRAYLDMLSFMIAEKIDENTVLAKPSDLRNNPMLFCGSTIVFRPELGFLDAQKNLLNSQKSMLNAAFAPKLQLFFQGGMGRPGLNMLSNEWKPYYIGGVNFVWNFSALYTRKNDLQKIEVNKIMLDTQRETFIYSIGLEAMREKQEIRRLREQMQYDDKIISLRENIKRAAEAKVANGTMSVTDFLREVTRENIARQTKASHEIELLNAIYNLKFTTNN